jgi:DNA-binding NarL/FixJ family response regulator
VAPARGLDAGPLPALSSRELQVVERLAAGMTNRQIAEELFISVRTVDRHTARIYEKLGVNSRAAAASSSAPAQPASDRI